MMTSFETFMDQAWAEHAEAPELVADAFEARVEQVLTPAPVAALARLIAHVCGEHLGEWQRGIVLVSRLRDQLPGDLVAGAATELAVLERLIAALCWGAGDKAELARLPLPEQVAALALASSALAARDELARAIAAYEQALALARSRWPDAAPMKAQAPAALRALAVAGNKLASTLEERGLRRSPHEARAMLQAARAALVYWRLAGGWLEEERAHYRLARSALQARATPELEPEALTQALASAASCLAVCSSNAAPPFEIFFAQAVLALAQRAAGDRSAFEAARSAALTAYAQLGEDEQSWCTSELVEIGLPELDA
jgi:tetratricopeptide (TPR) repeat protein